MRVAIHQPNLLPWFGFFAKAAQADVLVLLDDVQFSRGSFTNRVRAMSQDGPRWLTVPVKKDHPKPLIRDARAVTDAHRRAHDVLRAWYGRMLFPTITSNWPLATANLMWLVDLFRILHVKTRMMRASELRLEVLPKAAGNVQLCRQLGADVYVAGSGADYDDPAVYEAAGIRYERMKFTHPVYEQRRPPGTPFASGLSIVDALANVGAEETRRLLEESIR